MTLTTFKIHRSGTKCYRWWKGGRNCYEHEKQESHNDAIMKYLFNATMNGDIKGFYLKSKEDEKGWKEFKAYHRSTKENDTVQLSVGWVVNGNLMPTYDIQMKEFKDMEREGYSHGVWEVIA